MLWRVILDKRAGAKKLPGDGVLLILALNLLLERALDSLVNLLRQNTIRGKVRLAEVELESVEVSERTVVKKEQANLDPTTAKATTLPKSTCRISRPTVRPRAIALVS